MRGTDVQVRAADSNRAPHVPVLLGPLLAACAPVSGLWLDGTFGAGGYASGLLQAGAARVIGIDRDPLAAEMAAPLVQAWGGRLVLVHETFGHLADVAAEVAGEPLDGVVLDLGVSSMQLDRAERGFSFMKDGPLDMRMSQEGESAADLVNHGDEGRLADIIYHFGEERAARRIAKAIVTARALRPIDTTARLTEVVCDALPRPRPGQSHPATRTFQALRIAVNAEFQELVDGLAGAERALKPGGLLAVVTFHSLEDRIVKRFFQATAGGETGNRHAPAPVQTEARFIPVTRGAIGPDEAELAANPRARSARLRVGRRTAAAARAPDLATLDVPVLPNRRPTKDRR
jgi:16S rRNA (cytosine1402-N4)-methyltransferase